MFIRDLQAHLDLYSVYTRPVGSVGSQWCLYETCRLAWISLVFIRDLQAQQISIVFIRDQQDQLDPNGVYTRPVGSLGSLQCLYETCRLSISQQCLYETCRLSKSLQCLYETCRLSRSLQCYARPVGSVDLYSIYTRPVGSVDLYSVYTRPVSSVGSLQCL